MSLVENILNNVETLTSLNFNNRWMSAEVLEPIVDALTTNTTVQTLSLVNCGINAHSARILETLTLNSTLTHLDLGMNELQDGGMPSIAHLVEYNTSLYILDLSVNGITDVGAGYLANALLVNSTLIDLESKDSA